MTDTSSGSLLQPEVNFAGRQIIGTRPGQEDCYGIMPPGEGDLTSCDLLAILADGMGGHVAGEIASALAVDEFACRFLGSPHADDPGRLRDALISANSGIAEKVSKEPDSLQGMGTTLLALLVRGLAARWISVGDSPLMLWRAGQLHLLNAIHSFDNGAGGPEVDDETQVRPRSSILASALNGGALHKVDAPDAIHLKVKDILLAASDGINSLSFRDMSVILGDCENLHAAAITERILDCLSLKATPDQDNATLVVVKIGNPS